MNLDLEQHKTQTLVSPGSCLRVKGRGRRGAVAAHRVSHVGNRAAGKGELKPQQCSQIYERCSAIQPPLPLTHPDPRLAASLHRSARCCTSDCRLLDPLMSACVNVLRGCLGIHPALKMQQRPNRWSCSYLRLFIKPIGFSATVRGNTNTRL